MVTGHKFEPITLVTQATRLIHSSIAQLVEHAAVNRRVVGSSPTWGAIQKSLEYQALLVNDRRETVESGSICLSKNVMSLV